MHSPRNVQSPYVAADFWAQYSSATPRMSFFLKITAQAQYGSTVLGFTSNTRDMTLPGHPGVTFKSSPGITPTSIEMALDEPTNLEMTGIYQSGTFTQQDVTAGKWNFAEAEIFLASWQYPEKGEFLLGKMNIGEIKDYQTYFTAEGRGLLSRLANETTWVTSRICRATFGDSLCKKDLNGTVTIDGTTYNITETGLGIDGSFGVEELELAVLSSSFSGNLPPENFYANGKVTCTSGANSGVSREIGSNLAGVPMGDVVFQIKRPFPYAFNGLETFTLIAGCDKTIESCMKFDNIINRRAEDYIPGIEQLQRRPN